MQDNDTTLILTKRLVGFPTVSTESNLQLIHFVRDYLSGYGVESRLSFDAKGGKANLFAAIGSGEGGVVLSGHSDVVPVAGQDWNSDPFVLREHGGKLYGRGTADMKGFIASVLAAVPKMLDATLREPVYLAFSYDEELGCLGAPNMIADLTASGIRPRAAIVGEPTSMEVVTSHKGIVGFRVSVRGVEGHSSLPQNGVNAISWMAKVITLIEELGASAVRRGNPASGLQPPYTTFNLGTIQGGIAANVIAGRVELTCDARIAPWDSARHIMEGLRAAIEQRLLPAMQALDSSAAITLEETSSVPALSGADTTAADLVRQVAGNEGAGSVSFATEGGLFEQAGIPSVIYGPGSIMQAHRPDEYIEVESLAAADTFLERLIGDLSD